MAHALGRKTAGSLFALCAALASEAQAQPLPERVPSVRIDIDLGVPFSLAAPGTGVDGSYLGVGAALRVATRSGVGVLMSTGVAGRLGDSTASVVTPYLTGSVIDLMAFYRFGSASRDLSGLGLDLSLGVSYGDLTWNGGHGAYTQDCSGLSLNCREVELSPYTSPPPSFKSGSRIGPALGLGVDVRAGAFVIGLNVTYRALFFNGAAPPLATESDPVSAVSLFLHVGFGFAL